MSGPRSIGWTMTTKLPPLSSLGLLLFPLTVRMAKGSRRQFLMARRTQTVESQKTARTLRTVEKHLAKESNIFGERLLSRLTQLGFVYLPTKDHQSAGGQKIRKAQRVQFAARCTSNEILWYRVLTTSRGVFKKRNALPYGVRVRDLMSPETMEELSASCQRKVTAFYDPDNPQYGAWLCVNRLEGVGGIPRLVRYKDILDKYPADMSKATVVLGIGKNRATHTVDLATYPHLLIAGGTGSGKSNVVKNMVASLMMMTDPRDLKFVLIDLKQLEFPYFEKSAHLYKPEIVWEAEKAIETFEELITEITRRNSLLKGKATELSEWNELYPDLALPRIIVVIDEFAELMLASDADIRTQTLHLVQRATNLGRAVGVHFWVATQRPVTKVIDNSIKVNMPLIIAGRVQSKSQSIVMLDYGGATEIPKDTPGRMIVQTGVDRYDVQTPLIEREDLLRAVAVSRGRGAGLITFTVTEPQIIPGALARYLAEQRLPLHQGTADSDLAQYAISRTMFKAFVEDLMKTGQIADNGQTFRLARERGAYYLHGDARVETVPVTAESEKVEAEPPRRRTPILKLLKPEQPTMQERGQKALEMMREIRKTKEIQGA